jgi:hypothetical protein
MYKCRYCGETFAVPATRDGVEFCRACGSSEVECIDDQLEECSCCGKKVLKTGRMGVCSKCEAQIVDLWGYLVVDAMLVTHKEFRSTDEFLKEYFMDTWRNEK